MESLIKLLYEKNLILTLAHLLDLPGNEFQCLKWAKTGFYNKDFFKLDNLKIEKFYFLKEKTV